MFDGMTAKQILAFIQQATAAYEAAASAEQDAYEERRARIQNSIDALTELIGPEDATPSLTSIRGVQAYSDQQIEANVILAVRLILQGMEQIALITRDVAETVA